MDGEEEDEDALGEFHDGELGEGDGAVECCLALERGCEHPEMGGQEERKGEARDAVGDEGEPERVLAMGARFHHAPTP